MDVGDFLQELGLQQYEPAFRDNGIDIGVLPKLTAEDLKDLGVAMVGHRRLLLEAMAALQEPTTLPANAAGDALFVPTRGAQTSSTTEAERRPLSVMFCDLIGSTALSSRLDPEDLREVIRSYQACVATTIRQFDGFIARYVGDGVLIYFGWPEARETDAERAVRAGLAVAAEVGAAPRGGESLQVRIGIATGLVVIGEPIGSGDSRQHTAVGETPNLAARLQGLAGPNQVVIDAPTRRQIGGLFEYQDLGPVELKGLPVAVPAWQVLREGTLESRFEAREDRPMPLIGREQEMGLLQERFERAAAGEGQAVLLSGEAGIGKSHLVQALYDRLASTPDPPTRIRMQCAPLHAASALHPIIRHLRYAAGFVPDEGPDERLDKLEVLLRQAVAEIGRSAALLAPLLSLPGDRYGALVDLTPEQRNDELMRALVDQLRGMAARNTVLFVLEDVHWIDPATRELMERLLPAISNARILVLITHRPDLQLDWTRHPHVTALSLNRLSRSQVVAFVRAAGGAALSEEIVTLIGERAGGVPLFIAELTRLALETDKGLGCSNIPETLQACLLARLDRLGVEARELAQLAAVIGREFELDLLRAVSSKPSEAIAAALDRLVGSQIVLPASSAIKGAYVFRHALIQEAAYQSLLTSRRRLYHRDIARALERTETEGGEPEIIAQHFTAASLPEQAVPHWLQAGRRAMARLAVSAAIAHFQRGLQLGRALPEARRQVLELLLALGDALGRTANVRAALEAFEEGATLAREMGAAEDLARAALGAEETELVVGGERAAFELLEEALVTLGPAETAVRCRVLSRLGRALLIKGEIERANALSWDAITMARRLGDRRALLDALVSDRAARTAQPYPASQFPEMRGLVGEMVVAAEEIGDPMLIDGALAHAMPVALEMGDSVAVEAVLAQLDTNFEQHNAGANTYFHFSTHAMQAILHGDFVDAERLAEAAFETRRDFEYAAGVYGVQMFTIRREQGRLAEVAPVIRRFIDENPRNKAWRPGMALIASDLGFDEMARKSFEYLAADDFAFPVDAKFTLTLSYLAEVCARLADVPRAERLYDRLLPYRDLAIVAPTATVCCGAAARYLGMLATTLGDWTWAETHFEAALEMDGRLRAWPWLAHTKHQFALMLLARGRPTDRDKSKILLADAMGSAQRFGMASLQSKI